MRKSLTLAIAGTLLALGMLVVGVRSITAQPAFDGQTVFRFDPFGDEQLWTDTLRMHEVIQAAVDPATALAVGLKDPGSGSASTVGPITISIPGASSRCRPR